MNDIEKQFYEEILQNIDHFVDNLISEIVGERMDLVDKELANKYNILNKKGFTKEELDALRVVIKNNMIGVIHSVLVSIDGGSALSNHGKALELIDFKTKKSLAVGALNENFMGVAVGEDDK